MTSPETANPEPPSPELPSHEPPSPEPPSPEPSDTPERSDAVDLSGISAPRRDERPDPADTGEVHAAPPRPDGSPYAALPPGSPYPVFSPWESLPHRGPRPVPPPVPRPVARPADSFSVAALVLGVLSIVLCWAFGIGIVLGILALVFGPTGLRRSAQSGSGFGRAMAGIITGAIGMVLSAAMLIGILGDIFGTTDCHSSDLTRQQMISCVDHGTP